MTKSKKIEHKEQAPESSSENESIFFYQNDLNGCEEYINSEYSEPTQPLYRWTKKPTTQDDIIPQYYLGLNNECNLELETTVEERTVSMYTSEEASKKAYSGILSRLEIKDKKELNDPSSGHKKEFIDRCGAYVSKFNLTKEEALVGKENKKGHVNVILKKGFDFNKCLDQDFGTKKILDDEM